jgi:signal transduction histidine kinase
VSPNKVRKAFHTEARRRRLHHRVAAPPMSLDRKLLDGAIAGVALERSRAGNALHILTGKLFEAQEEERRRIARELHDGLNQQLAMLAVEIGMLARKVPAEARELHDSVVDLRKRAEGLSDDLRMMTHQLHPAVLEHLGLVCAVRSHCAEFSQLAGIRVRLTTEQISGLPRDVSICLYRIVQEALQNIAKHSGATEASIRIRIVRGEIHLSIIDKGVGIDPDALRKTQGLGLISMRERVQLVNGQLEISASGSGTRIMVRVPITWKDVTE